MKRVKCIDDRQDNELTYGYIYTVGGEYTILDSDYYSLVEVTGGRLKARFEDVEENELEGFSNDELLKEIFRRLK